MARIKPNVLLTEPLHPKGTELLSSETNVTFIHETRAEKLSDAIRYVDALVCKGYTDVSRELIRSGARLKVIGKHGVGVDNVDLDAATEFGIPVVHSPGACTQSVAEHSVGIMLALAHRIPFFDRHVKEGDWDSRLQHNKLKFSNKTVGVVGYGKIGREAARICRMGFGMKVLAYNRSPIRDPDGAQVATNLDDVLRESDFVSLYVPANADSQKLIGQREFRLMKPTAYLINVSRGVVVDEQALIQALQEKRIAGAGIDTLDPEPPDPRNPLCAMDNVVLSPHNSSMTEEGSIMMSVITVEEVLAVLRGERPRYLANPDLYSNR